MEHTELVTYNPPSAVADRAMVVCRSVPYPNIKTGEGGLYCQLCHRFMTTFVAHERFEDLI